VSFVIQQNLVYKQRRWVPIFIGTTAEK